MYYVWCGPEEIKYAEGLSEWYSLDNTYTLRCG